MAEFVVRGVFNYELDDQLWEEVEPFIAPALMHGGASACAPPDIRRAILRRDMQLWLVLCEADQIVAVATTETVQYPRHVAVRVVTVGGKDMAGWAPVLDECFERFAVQVHAPYIEAYVRPGLVKTLAPLGYYKACTVVERRVGEYQ